MSSKSKKKGAFRPRLRGRTAPLFLGFHSLYGGNGNCIEHRASIEHLSNIYRTSIVNLSNIYVSELYLGCIWGGNSIEHLSNIYRTSIENLSSGEGTEWRYGGVAMVWRSPEDAEKASNMCRPYILIESARFPPFGFDTPEMHNKNMKIMSNNTNNKKNNYRASNPN